MIRKGLIYKPLLFVSQYEMHFSIKVIKYSLGIYYMPEKLLEPEYKVVMFISIS